MINDLLVPPVTTAESFGDPNLPPPLFPEEAALITRSVAERRREFGTVRVCAREALQRLGIGPVPILPGRQGAPRWPEGVVGSMTHCKGYRAAAVARSADVLAIGLDAEPNQPVPSSGVTEAVTLPEERVQLRALAAHSSDVCWDRLLFSAKESVYKAWFPLTGRSLDFREAAIQVDPVAGTFSARLLVPGPVAAGVRLPGFEGRWLVRHGLIVTAITVLQERLSAGRSRQPGGDRSASPADIREGV